MPSIGNCQLQRASPAHTPSLTRRFEHHKKHTDYFCFLPSNGDNAKVNPRFRPARADSLFGLENASAVSNARPPVAYSQFETTSQTQPPAAPRPPVQGQPRSSFLQTTAWIEASIGFVTQAATACEDMLHSLQCVDILAPDNLSPWLGVQHKVRGVNSSIFEHGQPRCSYMVVITTDSLSHFFSIYAAPHSTD